MSLEKIQLPGFVLADMYKDCLVELQDEREKMPEETMVIIEDIRPGQASLPEERVKYLGGNNRNVCVVVNDNNATHINEADLAFLSKILAACNLNLADIAVVNIHSARWLWPQIKEQLDPQYVLLFGVEPASIKLPFSIPYFQVQHFAGSTFVSNPPLGAMNMEAAESVALKRNLWNSLKMAFNIK